MVKKDVFFTYKQKKSLKDILNIKKLHLFIFVRLKMKTNCFITCIFIHK